MRLLAYRVATDQIDEYVRISEKSSLNALSRFVDVIIAEFQDEYLRKPNQEDLQRLLHIGEVRGFPGSSSDINVLNRSPVFNDIFEGRAPSVNFEVNGHLYNMGYYLADGIYPEWATFVQAIKLPQGPKARLFSQCQESARKDVDCAFGVLQAQFAILCNPALIWKIQVVQKIMIACIILHNMIVEDKREGYLCNEEYGDYTQFDQVEEVDDAPTNYNVRWHADMRTYLNNRMRIRNRETHHPLRDDLVENIWNRFGHSAR